MKILAIEFSSDHRSVAVSAGDRVLGLAREVATAYDRPISLPSTGAGAPIPLTEVPTGSSDRIQVAIDDEGLCPRYAAAVAEVRLGASPAWLAAQPNQTK